MCKVSFIVPVYNAAPFLRNCVDSILRQSFDGFELLLVDDGSTDGSNGICDQMAEKDPRIRVFHKENGGVSSSRNLGIKHSRGEWICFADADDIVLENGLQSLVDGISDEVDMVWGGYEVFDEDGEITYAVSERISEFITNKDGIEMLFLPKYYRYLGYVWGRLFRREVLLSSGIGFDEDIIYNEDRLFCTRYLCASSAGIRFFTAPVYGYFERANSAMGKLERTFQPTFVTDLTAMIRMRQVIHEHYQESEKMKEMSDFSCFASWRRIAGMRGYPETSLWTRLSVLMDIVKGLGFWRFIRYDWERNKNRIIKFIKKFR